MDAFIPPWLYPKDPGQALASGAAIGSRIQENHLQKQQLAQAGQRLQLETQRANIEDAAIQQKMKLDMEDAQRRFKAMQGYKYWTQMGGDPVEGMMRFGPEMGESLTGLGTLSNARRLQADVPSEVATTPEGTRIWKFGGRLYGFDKPTKADLPGSLTEEQKISATTIQGRLKQIDAAMAKTLGPEDPNYKSLKAKQVELEKQLQKILPSTSGEEDDTGADDDVVATYDPDTGTFKKSGQ